MPPMCARGNEHGRSSSAWPRAPSRPSTRLAPQRSAMKLLFTKRAYARVGGSESLAYQFATRLAARGHDVRVVCAQAFDDRRVFTNEGVEVVQVKPRGGFLGSVADASTLIDLMRTDVLEWYAEDREIIHNIGREYLDSSLEVAEALGTPRELTKYSQIGRAHV